MIGNAGPLGPAFFVGVCEMSEISKKTLYEFAEYFKDFSTVRGIEVAFDCADIDCDDEFKPNDTSARRSRVQQYYATVDRTVAKDVIKLLRVFEAVLNELTKPLETFSWEPGEAENNQRARTAQSLQRFLKKDGYTYVGGRLRRVASTDVHALPALVEAAAGFDMPELTRQVERLRAAVDEDPSLAIGTAKELLETTCKTILHDHGIATEKKWDLMRLVKETRASLSLLPADIPDTAKGSKTMKVMLNNLATLVQGLAELRNLYGTGHGRHGGVNPIQPRHARLAVGSAATLVTFLFETHAERKL